MTGAFVDPRWVRFPVIPGHEWAGTVIDFGANVDSVRLGERVVCEGMISCGRCRRCRGGQTQWCERIEALGFTRPGGYAEIVSVPARVVHRLADHVSFDAGVLVEPASVVLNGLDKVHPRPGEAVGVIGIGTIGALAILLLRLHSPAQIVAYGVRDEELELARRLGATDVVLVRGDAPAHRELDLVVETAGVPAAVELAARSCRPAGRALLLGIGGEGRSVTVPADLLVVNAIALVGSIAYTPPVWARVVAMVNERVLDLDPIVTHRFPASEFEEAVRLMDNRRGVVAKIVLEHA
jgi:threonine dehydrogenase-like Zn-dependent dehydrogenase